MVSMSRLQAKVRDEAAILARLCIEMATNVAIFGLFGALLAWAAVRP